MPYQSEMFQKVLPGYPNRKIDQEELSKLWSENYHFQISRPLTDQELSDVEVYLKDARELGYIAYENGVDIPTILKINDLLNKENKNREEKDKLNPEQLIAYVKNLSKQEEDLLYNVSFGNEKNVHISTAFTNSTVTMEEYKKYIEYKKQIKEQIQKVAETPLEKIVFLYNYIINTFSSGDEFQQDFDSPESVILDGYNAVRVQEKKYGNDTGINRIFVDLAKELDIGARIENNENNDLYKNRSFVKITDKKYNVEGEYEFNPMFDIEPKQFFNDTTVGKGIDSKLHKAISEIKKPQNINTYDSGGTVI